MVNALPVKAASAPCNHLPDAGPGIRGASVVGVRRFPYPYEAALAICSDLDETRSLNVYCETARFLNTTEKTAMGRGVGLDVGNTLYFDMPHGQFSYWNTDDAGRAMVRELIRSGHVDCLHSYGDHATHRSHAEKALESLSKYGCNLEVWIDHATALSNFGADIMCGQGDASGSDVYHADLSCAFGIRFVWLGRVTSVIGQDSIKNLKGIWNPADKKCSFITVTKELGKGLLARLGNAKYAMHYGNALMHPIRLRDGHEVFEFMRCNPHWKGVSAGETADGIAQVLVPRVLDQLVETKGVCILYTHLGKFSGPTVPFGQASINGFRTLSRYFSDGKILVSTTSRLLKYNLAVRELTAFAEKSENGGYSIQVTTAYPKDLGGLTFYTPEPEKTLISINSHMIDNLKRNPADRTGQRSISLPWPRLTFPLLNRLRNRSAKD